MRHVIDFMAVDDDKGEPVLIARAKWPFVPRKGESVILENLRFKRDEEKPIDEQVTDTVLFVVEDVRYQMDAFHTFGREIGAEEAQPCEECDVEVFLVLPPMERGWQGLTYGEDT